MTPQTAAVHQVSRYEQHIKPPWPVSKHLTNLNMAASFASRVVARNAATSTKKTHMRRRMSRRSVCLQSCTLVHLLLSFVSIISFPSTRTTTSQAFFLSPLPGASPSWLRGHQRLGRLGRLRAVEHLSGVSAVGNTRSDGGNGYDRDGSNNGYCGNNGDGGGGGGGEPDHPVISITTFNVLAPIFKRVGSGRESDFREAYLQRHADILDHLKVCSRCATEGTSVGVGLSVQLLVVAY